MPRHVCGMLFAALACLVTVASAEAQSNRPAFVTLQPEDVEWKQPLGLGVAITTLHGDPAKPGLFIQRVRFPPGVFDRPHFHNGDRHVTVIKGTWYVGMGKDWEPAKATAMKPGSYMFQPAHAVHWDGAKDEDAVLLIMGEGPATSTAAEEK